MRVALAGGYLPYAAMLFGLVRQQLHSNCYMAWQDLTLPSVG